MSVLPPAFGLGPEGVPDPVEGPDIPLVLHWLPLQEKLQDLDRHLCLKFAFGLGM